jgi:hypothetical protein
MNNNPILISFKDYLIEIDENLNYVIKKDNKIVTKCDQIKFATLPDAELHAKSHINKFTMKNDGWIIS